MRAGDRDVVMDASGAPSAGIWTFIALDCTSFALFFLVFMSERFGQGAEFDRQAHLLDVRLGLLNTAILITSSWLVALGVQAGRDGKGAKARSLLIAALAIGSLFGCIKIYEYIEKLQDGLNVASSEFLGFYFALTGVHLLHYVIGLGVLVMLIGLAPGINVRTMPGSRTRRLLEGGALFWHMVDLLWVFLFTMLYLPGARG